MFMSWFVQHSQLISWPLYGVQDIQRCPQHIHIMSWCMPQLTQGAQPSTCMRAEGREGKDLHESRRQQQCCCSLASHYQGTLQMSLKGLCLPGVHLKFHLRQLTGVSAKKIQTLRPQLRDVLPYQGPHAL